MHISHGVSSQGQPWSESSSCRLGRDPKLQAVRFLASIAAGGGVAVLLSRSKQGARQGKAKVDPKDEDGPPRSGDLDWQVVSASDR